jgi:hypothetical protein
MSARTWRLVWRSLDLPGLRQHGVEVAANYDDVTVEVEEEERGTHTVFFTLPGDPLAEDEEDTGPQLCEISIYNLGRGEIVLSLELDAGDNDRLGDAADQLAEDLVAAIGGEPLDLD